MKEKELFLETLEQIDNFYSRIDEYRKLGIDFYESEVDIISPFNKIHDILFETIYSEKGIDWINWFIFENDFGRLGMEAYDEDLLICQTAGELFNYIEQYRING